MTRAVRLALIDHGAGNLVSAARALERAGASVRVATTPREAAGADGWVLPGVGATGAAMRRLEEAGFSEAIHAWEGPLLGICVGLQLFYEWSAEDANPCLALEGGTVELLQDAPRLPHIGWNELITSGDPLFDGVSDDATAYFVHSYAAVPSDPETVIATSEHGSRFVAAIRNGDRVGVQFHPERSGDVGAQIIRNYVRELALVGSA